MSSRTSEENDCNGSWYQELVAKHLEKKTGLSAIIKDSHGIDVICGEYSVEVKGMKNLHKKPSKAGYVKVNSWKIDQTTFPADITHVAFVLNEEFVGSQLLIYFVVVEDIRKRFDEKSNSQYVYFPLHWVFNHLIFDLSRIPQEKEGGD